MVSIVTKKIKGNEYVYSVENEWKRKGSRQKVKGYIGRGYRFLKPNDIGFLEYLKIENISSYLESNDKDKIINDPVEAYYTLTLNDPVIGET